MLARLVGLCQLSTDGFRELGITSNNSAINTYILSLENFKNKDSFWINIVSSLKEKKQYTNISSRGWIK